MARVKQIQKSLLNTQEQQKRRDQPLTACFKIKTAESLKLFEERLQKEEFAYVQIFRDYRPDVKNPAHSGLGRIFSDEFMETFNLKGVKGRKVFKDSPSYNALWRAWGPDGGQYFTDINDFDASLMSQINASRNRRYVKKNRAKAQKV